MLAERVLMGDSKREERLSAVETELVVMASDRAAVCSGWLSLIKVTIPDGMSFHPHVFVLVEEALADEMPAMVRRDSSFGLAFTSRGSRERAEQRTSDASKKVLDLLGLTTAAIEVMETSSLDQVAGSPLGVPR